VLAATGSPHADDELAGLRDLAVECGWRVRLRNPPGSAVLRLSIPAPNAAEAVPATAPARGARRVLLLHRSDVERELVATVLRENGWKVEAAEREPGAGTFDLVLVERRLALEDPSLPGRARLRFAPARVELLEPRMRPGDLLALISL